MKASIVTFTLENSSTDLDVMAVLIPAMLRRNGLLDGKFLKNKSFKDESGTTDILVTSVTPAGAIAELSEYASQLENVHVISISVETPSMAQAIQSFVQKTYVEFKDALVENLETSAAMVVGKSAVLHTFKTAFLTAPMKSLEMKLLKGEKVTVTLSVMLPDLTNSTLPVLS